MEIEVAEYHLNVEGCSIFVRQRNKLLNRPTVVFLHDSLGCVQLWRDFPEKLSGQLNCNMLIYDRQGYGRSSPLSSHRRTNRYLEDQADFLYKLIQKLQLKQVILFGHSDGGSIALIAAGKYPSQFDAIIVEAAHLFVEEVTIKGIQAAVREYEASRLKTRLEKYHGEKTDTLFRAWAETWLSKEFQSWNIEHFLQFITSPVLFIQGEKDEYGTIKQMEAVSRQVRGYAETHLIPGVHHTPHRESDNQVISVVQSFLLRRSGLAKPGV